MSTDWKEHDGKGMPVDRESRVDVRFSDGEVFENLLARLWSWGPYLSNVPMRSRIVAYRVR